MWPWSRDWTWSWIEQSSFDQSLCLYSVQRTMYISLDMMKYFIWHTAYVSHCSFTNYYWNECIMCDRVWYGHGRMVLYGFAIRIKYGRSMHNMREQWDFCWNQVVLTTSPIEFGSKSSDIEFFEFCDRSLMIYLLFVVQTLYVKVTQVRNASLYS